MKKGLVGFLFYFCQGIIMISMVTIISQWVKITTVKEALLILLTTAFIAIGLFLQIRYKDPFEKGANGDITALPSGNLYSRHSILIRYASMLTGIAAGVLVYLSLVN